MEQFKNTEEKVKKSTKFRNWFMNRAIKAQWIHKSSSSRKKFNGICFLYIFILIVLYAGCGALLSIDGLGFHSDGYQSPVIPPEVRPANPKGNTDWYYGVKYTWAFVVAIISLCVLFIISFLSAIYIPILYKWSKLLYFQTDEYKENVIKYANVNLKRYSMKQIKWLKKLGYIDKITYLFYKKPSKKNK